MAIEKTAEEGFDFTVVAIFLLKKKDEKRLSVVFRPKQRREMRIDFFLLKNLEHTNSGEGCRKQQKKLGVAGWKMNSGAPKCKRLTSFTSIEFNVNVSQFHSKHELVMKTLRVKYFS